MNSTITPITSQPEVVKPIRRRIKYQNFDILAEEYLKIQEKRKQLEEQEKALKERLDSYVSGIEAKSYSSKQFILIQCQRKGNIEYSLIPELKKINLELFRKDPIIYWKVIKL
jgi:hypothetical protein